MESLIKAVFQLGPVLCEDEVEQSHWEFLCNQLPVALSAQNKSSLSVRNASRKWELVSAYQKTVRRGNADLAKHLICGMVSLQEERQYMWKRICTTVCEDVGAGNPTLMKFVLAVSSVFTPSKMSGQQALDLWIWLTEMMACSDKSRLYCQFSILENCIKEGAVNAFGSTGHGFHVRQVLATPVGYQASTEGDKWLCKADWRGEGMASGPVRRVQIPGEMVQNGWNPPAVQSIAGLPDYAYDMHTSVGKGVCIKLCGHVQVKNVFNVETPKDKTKAVGYAMFFEEGGRIQAEWQDPQVTELEQRVVAEKHGLSYEAWKALRAAVAECLSTGYVNSAREKKVASLGYLVKNPGYDSH